MNLQTENFQIKEHKAEENDKFPVLFIRHGESQYNYEAELLRKKLGIGATWQQYKANPQFMKFKYSQAMIDCQLSQRGRQQCQKLSQRIQNKQSELQFNQIDLILVSPLFRTLQSCSIIFKHLIEQNKKIQQQGSDMKKIPIIVEPLLSQSLRCACDVSFNLFRAKEQFPDYDYSAINGLESEWYINNQNQEKKNLYKKLLEQNKKESYQERAKYMTKYMQQTHNFESSLQLIQRAERAKEKIKQYKHQYGSKKIAIVSHFYLIGYLITESKDLDESGKPLHKFDIKNAEPIQYFL